MALSAPSLDNDSPACYDPALRSLLASTWHILQQPPPPSLREILGAYKSRGDGDREMLLAMLEAKSAEDKRLASSASLHETMLQVHRGHQEAERPNPISDNHNYPYNHPRISSHPHQSAYSPPPQSITFSPLQDQALPHASPSFSPPNVTLPAIRSGNGTQAQLLKHPQTATNLPSSSSHHQHHTVNGHAYEGLDHSHRDSPRKRARSSRSPRPSLSRRQSQQSSYTLNPVQAVNGHNHHHNHHSHRVDGSPRTHPVHLQNDCSNQAYRDGVRPSDSPYMSDRQSVSSSSSHSHSQSHPQRGAMAIDSILSSSSRSGPAASSSVATSTAVENGTSVLSEERDNLDRSSEPWPPRTSSERSSSTRGHDSGDNTASSPAKPRSRTGSGGSRKN